MTGDGEGHVPAQVLLDQGEGEVDAGGDTGGGGDLTVADVDGVGVDLDGRVGTGERGAVRPVGRGAAAVQEARGTGTSVPVRASSGTTVRPLEVRTGAPSRDAVRMR